MIKNFKKINAKELKEQVGIVNLINKYVPLDMKNKGVCPFHDDKDPSMSVSNEYKNFRCWSCGAKGDVFTFLQMHLGLSFVESLNMLDEMVNGVSK